MKGFAVYLTGSGYALFIHHYALMAALKRTRPLNVQNTLASATKPASGPSLVHSTPSHTVTIHSCVCTKGFSESVTGRKANLVIKQHTLECEPVAAVEKHSLEVQVLEREVRLHNACGLHSGPQDILLSRDVGGLGYPVQIVQVAESRMQSKGGARERKRR